MSDDLSQRPDPRASIESYRDGPEVVLYDAENPLAWLASSTARSIEESR